MITTKMMLPRMLVLVMPKMRTKTMMTTSKMRMKTIMTMLKCKQCALYLEAQGLFGPTMTSRSEAFIILMINIIVRLMIIIIRLITIIILMINIIVRLITIITIMINIIIRLIINIVVSILMMMIIIAGKVEMGLTEVGEYPFSWWLCSGTQCTAQKRD